METEKSEITNLPEGMSSEELDALTTGEEVEKTDEAGLAKEALEATEEESSPAEEPVKDEKTEEEAPEEEKPEVDPKDAVIGDFRRQNRELDLKNARLEGELEARKSMATTAAEPVKSPLEKAEAAYVEENGDLDGFAMNGELYRQQRAFDDEKVAKKSATEKEEQSQTTMARSVTALQQGEFSAEKVGAGLDFNSIVSLGQGYLDKADLMKIEIISTRDGVEAATRKAYELCKDAILAAGNEDSKLLKNAINIQSKKSQTKPKKEKTDIDALTTEGEETPGETETDTASKRLVDFIFAPD